MAIPSRGSEVVFQPLEHLQSIAYTRPPVSALGLSEEFICSSDSSEVYTLYQTYHFLVLPLILICNLISFTFFYYYFPKMNARLAAAEEAMGLSMWTTATVCRILSLETVRFTFFSFDGLVSTLEVWNQHVVNILFIIALDAVSIYSLCS